MSDLEDNIIENLNKNSNNNNLESQRDLFLNEEENSVKSKS